jgi:carbonic anhydrase/acetyltransferase-like protein (isoleucine patch superfamily)
LQDFVMVHICGNRGTTIGAYTSITHKATVHGCTIGDNCLIGINATVMDNVVIGDNSVVAGHSIVTAGTVIPANSVVAGVPAKVIKENRGNFVSNRMNALIYHRNGLAYANGDHRGWDGEATQAAIAADREKVLAEFAEREAANGGKS